MCTIKFSSTVTELTLENIAKELCHLHAELFVRIDSRHQVRVIFPIKNGRVYTVSEEQIRAVVTDELHTQEEYRDFEVW